MNDFKYGYKNTGIHGDPIYNAKTGEIQIYEIKEPKKIERDYSEPVLHMVKRLQPNYPIMSNELLNKYGYYYGGCDGEGWYWHKLENATELELWKMFAIIRDEEIRDKEYYELMKEYNENKHKDGEPMRFGDKGFEV